MLTFVRTAAIAPGKLAEAMAFAQQAAKLVEKITGHKPSINVPVGGNPFRIAFVTPYASLAELETARTKLYADPEYVKFIDSSAGAFLPGSAHDEMWRSMS